jgi:hypothetical protein
MKRLLTVSLTIAIMACCGAASAGQIWTDGDGDGLPDGGPTVPQLPSTNVTVGVWIDAQSFSWTNFLAYIEWSGDCISYVSASYVISGGSNFPIDNFSHPRGIGFGGSGYAQGGVDHIGNVTLHLNAPVSCCVTPIIDVYNPYYVFSQLGAGSAYMLFSTNPGSCNDGGPQVGACCFPDGSCVVLPASECAAQGGIYRGDGVSCADAQCEGDIVEACCFPDGSCVEAIVGQCPAGSVGQGSGTNCSPSLCPPTTEACCLCAGQCVDAPVGQCPEGSIPQGPGTSCATVECLTGPPTPCCLPDGSCIEGISTCECTALGGMSRDTCADCATAVESKSWGKIKGLFR